MLPVLGHRSPEVSSRSRNRTDAPGISATPPPGTMLRLSATSNWLLLTVGPIIRPMLSWYTV